MMTINEDIDFNSCNDYMICGHSDEEEIFQKHNTVSKLHRRITRHHAEFIFPKYRDYIGMAIDWECASLTKSDKQLNARQTLEKYYPELKEKIYPLINKIGL